jgi:hypothetical protein
MTKSAERRLDGTTLVVRIPMCFHPRGGRKRILAPDGSAIVPSSKPQPDGTLLKALSRAWRWQRLLDDGVYATVSEIGDAESISKSYVSRILRLALLAPDLVEEILEGAADQDMMLEHWSDRCRRVGRSSGGCSAHARPKDNGRPSVRDTLHAGVAVDSTKHRLQRRNRRRYILYFLVSAFPAPGFGLAGALGALPAGARIFFLSALGFLASRLLLF